MDITITQANLLYLLIFGWTSAALVVFARRTADRIALWYGLTLASITALGLVFTVAELWRIERIVFAPTQILILAITIFNLQTIMITFWIKYKSPPVVGNTWQSIFLFRTPPAAAVLAPKKPTWRERFYITFAQLCVTGLLSFAAYCLLAIGPQPCSWPDHLLGGPNGCVETIRPNLLFGDTPEKIDRSPDGSMLAVAYFDSYAEILRRDGTRLHRLPHDGWVQEAVFSPDGALLATSDETALRIWSVRDGTLLHSIPADGANQALAFSPDSTLLLGDAGDGRLSAWRIEDGAQARTFETGLQEGYLGALAMSPDGSLVAAGLNSSETDEIRIWRWPDGTVLQRIADQSAIDLAFAPDSRTLATAVWQSEVAIWDLSSGQQRYNLQSAQGVEGRVKGLTFTSDGAAVAAGFSDGTIQLWRTADGRPLHTFRYTSSVEDLVFDRDGRLILSANDDDSIRAWRLPR